MDQHRREGMIDKTFRWFGEHPKVCLLPVLGFGLLAGAHLLAYSYGEKLMPEPFGYLVALALVLATLASLNVALAWWVRHPAAVNTERAPEMRMRNPGVIIPQPPGWNARDIRPPVRGHAFPASTYGSDRAEHDVRQAEQPSSDEGWDAMTQHLFLPPLGLDPPSGDVSKSA